MTDRSESRQREIVGERRTTPVLGQVLPAAQGRPSQSAMIDHVAAPALQVLAPLPQKRLGDSQAYSPRIQVDQGCVTFTSTNSLSGTTLPVTVAVTVTMPPEGSP